MFNDRILFVGKLMPTKEYIIVTVGGSDFGPTHYGLGEVSIRDDNGTIVKIHIHKAP